MNPNPNPEAPNFAQVWRAISGLGLLFSMVVGWTLILWSFFHWATNQVSLDTIYLTVIGYILVDGARKARPVWVNNAIYLQPEDKPTGKESPTGQYL